MALHPDPAKRSERLLKYGRPATYRTEESSALKGNMLVEAMEPVLAGKRAEFQLAKTVPARSSDFLHSPVEVRLEGLNDLKDIYIPTPQIVDAYSLIHRAIRASYRSRDPSDPRVMAFLYQLAEADEPSLLPRLSDAGGGSNGIMIVGTTGVGKTSFVDRVMAYLSPTAIIHTKLGGRPCYWPQVVIFRVQAAETKTVAGIAAAIAAQADALTGARYSAELRRKPNRGAYLVFCCQILSSLMAGILIVEDLQLLKSAGTKAVEILDFLANIMETTGIPVASVSTFRVYNVVDTNTAVGSKLRSGGSQEFLPLLPGLDFDHLVQVYWSLRITRGGGSEMPGWLPTLSYSHTGGVRRFARELFQHLFNRMAVEGVAVPNQKFFRACAKESVGRYAGAVNCLRRAQRGGRVYAHELVTYEDLFDTSLMREQLRLTSEAAASERSAAKDVSHEPTDSILNSIQDRR
jgi:hypothetical protein